MPVETAALAKVNYGSSFLCFKNMIRSVLIAALLFCPIPSSFSPQVQRASICTPSGWWVV